MSLELRIWREACRRIELNDFISRVTPLLVGQLPIQLLLVRRLDVPSSRLETLAGDTGERASQLPRRARTELSSEELEQVLAWIRTGKVLRAASRDGGSLLPLIVPPEISGAILAGPLVQDEGPVGIVVFIAPPGERYTSEHEATLRTVLEPFKMAFFLDRQFHELARLREAAEADNRALLSRLGREDIVETIVGAEGGLREVMGRVDQVAPTDAPVLVLGETGAGKEVVARAIHARSRRSGGPVLRVNCGAIPPEIIDSELFGHERGSFTGAVNMRRGWFERADGGTLFLDEIGELPLAAQVRLLRILQDGSFERVGGQRTLSVDVRIVAATHMDLPAMVAAGSFRKDLWYRLSVFIIRLPSLREHKEDIPSLARYFAARAGRRLTGTPLEPTERDIALLSMHDWPGNVRELGAVIERAAILGNCRYLDVQTAMAHNIPPPEPPQPALDHSWSHHAGGMTSQEQFEGTSQLELMTARRHHPQLEAHPHLEPTGQGAFATLDVTMSHHITEALTLTRGRIEGPHGAAALLGINPHTLRARMRKLRIDWRIYRTPVRDAMR